MRYDGPTTDVNAAAEGKLWTSLTLSLPWQGDGRAHEDGREVSRWWQEQTSRCLVSVMREMIAKEVRSYLSNLPSAEDLPIVMGVEKDATESNGQD
ncbi:homeodomain-like protein [Canna indica]|uniref:Homeodomain-like protein n=1 Tax=Canna indica TaxID=4628 RepID=A0AAQ3Q2P2_9LILI|nr:homeodomain-like protein [Canna indica]